MESMNKFKVLTMIIICLFFFAIAAMYVNTKDVSQAKNQESYSDEDRDYDTYRNSTVKEAADFEDVKYALKNLESKVNILDDKVNRKLNSQKSSEPKSSGMRCKIIGSKTNSGIESLSPEVAIQDAQINGNDIVVTCSLR